MRTHEHALVSVTYVFVNSLMFDLPVDNISLYVAAVLGGEILDIIDHPLHFFVYGRHQQHAVEAKKIFREEFRKSYNNNRFLMPFDLLRAIASAITKTAKYLNEVEDDRKIKGLWLHNVLALFLVAIVGFFVSLFVTASPCFVVFWGALLLHMICDILGDLWSVGHIDNWLWVIPKNYRNFQRKNLYIFLVLIMNLLVFSSFVLMTIRWGLYSVDGLIFTINFGNLLFIPFIGLTLYLFWLLLMVVFYRRKYNMHFRGAVGALWFLKRLFDNDKNKKMIDIYVYLQNYFLIWIFIGSLLVMSAILAMRILGVENEIWLFMIPFIVAVMLGVFVHSSVGELSSVLGVTISYFVDLFIARVSNQSSWASDRVLLFFGAAVTAWLTGLVGAIMFKGKIRMSLLTGFIPIKTDNSVNSILSQLEVAIAEGYRSACRKLFGVDKEFEVKRCGVDQFIVGLAKHPMAGVARVHWRIRDRYSPVIRELAYLWSVQYTDDVSVCCPPIMPRSRVPREAEMSHIDYLYRWNYNSNLLVYETPVRGFSVSYLSKSASELLDNLLTIQSDILSDVFVIPNHGELLCYIITREVTSTKEFSSIESEIYLREIVSAVSNRLGGNAVCSRIVFSDFSIHDSAIIGDLRQRYTFHIFGSHENDPMAMIAHYIKQIPSKNVLHDLSSNFQQKFWATAFEVALGSLIVFLVSYLQGNFEYVRQVLGL